jgi:hypothetical protein
MGFLIQGEAVGGGGEPARESGLFSSDWRHATGAGDEATRDGASGSERWTSIDNGGWITVVSAAGLGFPDGMTNVIRFTQHGDTESSEVQKNGIGSPPSIGEIRRWRLYWRCDEGNQPSYDHGIQPSIGSCAVTWAIKKSPQAGGVHIFHQFGDTGGDQYYGLINSATGANILLAKNTVYRFEWDQDWLSSSTYKLLRRFVFG